MAHISALLLFQHTAARRRLGPQTAQTAAQGCFNTQPPEGGWDKIQQLVSHGLLFQHTAARRRLAKTRQGSMKTRMFQHTAARRRLVLQAENASEPKTFQHTAARRRLAVRAGKERAYALFQHTAARRRLAGEKHGHKSDYDVSTHSHPKAAGFSFFAPTPSA